MSIYTIGDLHLSFNENKPMNIFGENWNNHEEKIKKDWLEKVNENDLVVLPGDFSWSMKLKDTLKDFEYLNQLPGKKLLLKGNHDYWWTTVTSMKNFLKENNIKNVDFLYNNSYEYENYIVAGTRGWTQLEDSIEDRKILNREALRLEMSIQDAIQKNDGTKEVIVFMHYPPVTAQNVNKINFNIFIKMMKKYNIKRCFYGHLHSQAIKEAINGQFLGIEFKLVSCDGLDFKLLELTKHA